MGLFYIIGNKMETTNYVGVLYGGLNSNNGKENGNYYGILGFYMGGYIGIMEKKMETTIVYWGSIWGLPVPHLGPIPPA